MDKYLYPRDYVGEAVKPMTVARVITQRQRDDCKAFVDTKLGGVPKDYNVLIPLIEEQFPHVFTTSEMVALFDEMNADREPKMVAVGMAEEPLEGDK